MKSKRFLSIFMVLILLLTLFAGCGGSNSAMVSKTKLADAEAKEVLTDESGTAETIIPPEQKLIRTLYINAETRDMDALLTQVEAKINELGGYVEGREVHNGTSYGGGTYRNADLTIRIPAEKLNSFVSHMESASNVTSNRETTEDVTLNYIATESRIAALETEQTRLLELLAQAASMEDLLQIESRLTDVRAELEQVNSQLRLYDNLVDYSTIHLSVTEVLEYTEPVPDSVWARIGTGFKDSLKGLGNFFVEIFVFIVSNLPALLVLAIIATAAVWLVKRRKKKKAAKKECRKGLYIV